MHTPWLSPASSLADARLPADESYVVSSQIRSSDFGWPLLGQLFFAPLWDQPQLEEYEFRSPPQEG